MQSKQSKNGKKKFIWTKSRRFVFGSVVWVVLISGLHWWLNFDHGHQKIFKMGYMPVVTNMAAPLLDYAGTKDSDVRFKALKFSSFAEMGEALRNDHIQAAFIIAPLSIVLRQQGADVKVIYIGNRHESTLVTRKDLNIRDIHELAGRTVAVPMRFSGHNLSLLRLMEENDMRGEINIVELNPPDMAAALVTGSLDAYYVGEPFAARTLKNGNANLLFNVEEVWKSFICNLVIVKQSLIDEEPEIVEKFVNGAVRSGIWAEKHPDEAAEIAAQYWSQPVELVQYALHASGGRTLYDQYLPKIEEMQEIADLMVRYKLIDNNKIDGLVDQQFAKNVDTGHVETIDDILR
ncbi:NitT/TauT family transport system substrate-binding protein [Candidatus Electrothrix marina]|uniref:NitT/TauT family transport system substrate-binding protein n=1 Tax=Candidatus Electrothrix marina TaxID=1859130 RepID=A0A3S4TFK0_9BACT|nr:NitT/TauT family transport system substrate-binding protein [Candidatus Electrothrix marina]